MYDLIYIDPPWWYNFRKAWWERNNKTKFGWGARKHYPLMKDNELLNFKNIIDNLTSKDCIIFMWATMPKLDFAIDLMKYWWFNYKTVAFTWVKINKNWGYRINPWYYTASNIELVLVGIKWKNWWKFKPTKSMINQIIAEPIREHSRKPDKIRENLDIMYPNLKKIEIFARCKSQGWDVYWNEIYKFNNNNGKDN